MLDLTTYNDTDLVKYQRWLLDALSRCKKTGWLAHMQDFFTECKQMVESEMRSRDMVTTIKFEKANAVKI